MNIDFSVTQKPEMPPTSTTIHTGARLHFGPLSFRPDRGRHFGGIGMMIKEPGYRVTVSLSHDDQITNQPERVPLIVAAIRNARPDWDHRLSIQVDVVIPSHQGLGSGTQLAMALAEGIARAHGETEFHSESLAKLGQRGERSSIGLHGYFCGGFLIDAGHASGEAISPISVQHDFPEEWPILLLTPPASQGMSGPDETRTFEQLSPMTNDRTGELCRLALTEILPAIRTKDFPKFAQAIREYGDLVGDFFRRHQGGVYSHAAIGDLVELVSKHGFTAAAQTSWGPTIAFFTPNFAAAEQLKSCFQSAAFGRTCSITVTRSLNTGRHLTEF